MGTAASAHRFPFTAVSESKASTQRLKWRMVATEFAAYVWSSLIELRERMFELDLK